MDAAASLPVFVHFFLNPALLLPVLPGYHQCLHSSKVITEKLNKENRIRQPNFSEAFSVEDPFIVLTCLHRSPSLLLLFSFMTSALSDFLLTGKQRPDDEFQFSVYLLV